MPDRRVDVFMTKRKAWRAELEALRAILLETPLVETFKWRQPCYTSGGTNIAILGAYKKDCVISFFRGALLEDTEGILEPPGPNSRFARVARFTSVAEIGKRKSVLKKYVLEAIGHAEAGRSVEMPKDEPDWPSELTEALDEDAELKTAFAALTPGRQRGWVIHFSGAKQSATRSSRIAKATPRILDGKGLHDR